jgi:hypothetical protein
MNETKESKLNYSGLAFIIVMVTAFGLYIYLVYTNTTERDNLTKKPTNIGEEGYLSIDNYFFLNKDSAKYFTIKVTAIDVQNSNDDYKIVILHATFKNIRYDVIDINHYSYYLVTDEEHSYQSTALLTIDGTKVLKDTHKECVMKFSIPTNEKPVKLIIMEGDRIVKEIVLKHN